MPRHSRFDQTRLNNMKYEEQEIICALGNICHSETPNEESFFRVAKFYKIDDEILET